MHPRLIAGLSEIAAGYDALICDVWGVIHNGHRAHPAACAALARFRAERGPVVLLTNAPRTPAEVALQCGAYGVPDDCHDAIISSGGAARDELVRRAAKGRVPLYYIGPDRDLSILEGLDVARAGIADAGVALCIGLVDDRTETPADYADRLAAMRARDLTMLCANPDLQVHRGAQLVYCAGALAQAYEALGGQVIYYGKPHRPVYDAAIAAAGGAGKRILAIGDAIHTDLKGANAVGLDVLFIADGLHGEEVEPYTAAHLADLFVAGGVTARAAARKLSW